MRLQTSLNTVRSYVGFSTTTPQRRGAVFAVKGGPSFAPQKSLDALDPQGCTTAVDHRLEYLLHPSSALKQQVAAIFGLIDRVLVVKFAPLLLLQAQREADASSVNPTLTDLGQSPYHPLLGQGVCNLSQAGGVGDARKTIPLFLEVNLLPAGLAGEILFGDLVFPLASFAVDHRNVSGFGESSQTTAEAASQAHEVRVVQMLFRPVQLLPPGAEPAAGVTHAKVGVQDKAIHTIVRSFEKVSVVLAQCVWHPVTLPHPQRSRKNNGDGRRVSTSCVCCPARGPFFRAKSRKKPRALYSRVPDLVGPYALPSLVSSLS